MSLEKEGKLGNIEDLLKGIFPKLVELRRNLHMFPELAWKEHRTTEKIVQFLEGMGFTDIQKPLETGLYSDLIQSPDLNMVALRADIDALPIADEKDVAYRSRHDGVCHACGHDVHTAVVCGVAAVLSHLKANLPVNVRFLFQPAEEPIPTGAPKFIEKGVLEGVNEVWGLHMEPALPLGTVNLTEGWVNAQNVRLKWEIQGKGGHSARPHQAIDPLWAGVRLVDQAYQLAYRQWTQPEFPVILSFTRFHSGTAYNALPDSSILEGTLRLTDPGSREEYLNQLRELNISLERTTGVQIRFTTLNGAPPVVNDTGIIRRFLHNMTELQKYGMVVEQNFRSMGGDDFGYYGEQLPTAMVRFGVREGKNWPQLHSGKFDVPEKVIEIAVRFFVWQILSWRNRSSI